MHNGYGKKIIKAPIIGFIRYSQKTRFSKYKKEKNVFEANYFEYRFNIFKNITLKCFQNQTNMNFVLLLLHSENMPSEYQKRFNELEKENFFLYNVFLKDNEESFDETLRNTIEYVSFEQKVALTFRVDNDDAVQNDFIQRLSCYLKEDFFNYSINMPNICIIQRISDMSLMVEERYYPSNSIGIAYITNREKYKTVMEFGNHDYLIEKTASAILINECFGLQTINGENEANAINTVSNCIKLYQTEQIEKYFDDNNFANMDLKCIRILKLRKFSIKKVLQLLMPPFLFLIVRRCWRKYKIKVAS